MKLSDKEILEIVQFEQENTFGVDESDLEDFGKRCIKHALSALKDKKRKKL